MSDANPVEIEARADGWVPKEEYRGNESDWVDAETFVERGRQINPILRANNARLKKELEAERKRFEKELEDMRKSTEDVKTFIQEANERKVQNLEKQLKELRAARSEATAQEDHEKAADIEEQIDKVKEAVTAAKAPAPEPQPKPQDNVEVTPEMQTWFGNNQWFDSPDYQEETALVATLGRTIRQKHPTVNGVEFLQMLDEAIDKYVPEVRGNKKKGGASPMSSARSGRATPEKRSYENLPPEAKAACDKYVKQKLMTREEYVAEFDWSE